MKAVLGCRAPSSCIARPSRKARQRARDFHSSPMPHYNWGANRAGALTRPPCPGEKEKRKRQRERERERENPSTLQTRNSLVNGFACPTPGEVSKSVSALRLRCGSHHPLNNIFQESLVKHSLMQAEDALSFHSLDTSIQKSKLLRSCCSVEPLFSA